MRAQAIATIDGDRSRTALQKSMGQLGRMLVLGGLALAGVGVLLVVAERLGLGRLPGDMLWKRKNTTVYFPVVTSLIVSVVLTVILNLLLRRK
jgi:hypothetical protein